MMLGMRELQEQFDIKKKIGSGSYGDVFKVRVRQTDQIAALKVIKIQEDDDLAIIEQEIQILRGCVHPNIVQYFHSEFRRQQLWITMEYCGGGSLQDIYKRTGALTEQQIAFVCRESLRGLDYLHQQQKLHRDIKGANILLTEDGDIKLADFGVAAQITNTFQKRQTFIGTPYWMAPEVANVEREGGYDQACDIWAVGITAIELAQLKPPLYEIHPMKALLIIGKSDYKPPKLKEKNLWTVKFHDFIKETLTKDYTRRPSAGKLLQHHFAAQPLSKESTRALLHAYHAKLQLKKKHKEMKRVKSVKHPKEEYKVPVRQPEKVEIPKPSRPAPSPSNHAVNPTPAIPNKPPKLPPKHAAISAGPSGTLVGESGEKPPIPPRAPTQRRSVLPSSMHPENRRLKINIKTLFCGCPMHIYDVAFWCRNEEDKCILIGTDEGVFLMSTNENEPTHQQFFQIIRKKTVWLAVHKDTLSALSGNDSSSLMLRFYNLNRLYERVEFSANILSNLPFLDNGNKVTDTKGCKRCTMITHPFHKDRTYLCAQLPESILLMQYDEHQNTFKEIERFPFNFPGDLPLFELFADQEHDYPFLCIGVKLRLRKINAFNAFDKGQTRFYNLDGTLKSSNNMPSVLNFSGNPLFVVEDCQVQVIIGILENGIEIKQFHGGRGDHDQIVPSGGKKFRFLGSNSARVFIAEIEGHNEYDLYEIVVKVLLPSHLLIVRFLLITSITENDDI
ncbi:uncharacterized protein TRIADDRAFT_51772 [Trichoplax adhaerens]|uniref:Mitogen-activated protein kinase kinase kinase kinase n=1 Tax=Trichoplax adhaerens TaxID=10228 RepID=B3RKU7_TRIAD|nr:hypothetical protein TRIADDRAFT_51772 [Trichoplax adhaerens]EDV29436.1 hypothetical protein TRIADDRAFT_51772 [Trichoplax adhaerens]|eukprot:XP_002108638.1 hypothetical protein TRIADDRAFT_51772 [Trichoplax adhaerens]